jgi:hypothetical protein
MKTERFLLFMKLQKVAQEAVEDDKFEPPISVICTDTASTSIYVLKVKVDANPEGKLSVVEEIDSGLALPPSMDVLIIDKNQKTKKGTLSISLPSATE